MPWLVRPPTGRLGKHRALIEGSVSVDRQRRSQERGTGVCFEWTVLRKAGMALMPPAMSQVCAEQCKRVLGLTRSTTEVAAGGRACRPFSTPSVDCGPTGFGEAANDSCRCLARSAFPKKIELREWASAQSSRPRRPPRKTFSSEMVPMSGVLPLGNAEST